MSGSEDNRKTKASTRRSGPLKYIVRNETDGILVHPQPMTWSSAGRLIREFRGRFGAQGYYLTARRERIRPDDVRLMVEPAAGRNANEMEPDAAKKRG